MSLVYLAKLANII